MNNADADNNAILTAFDAKDPKGKVMLIAALMERCSIESMMCVQSRKKNKADESAETRANYAFSIWVSPSLGQVNAVVQQQHIDCCHRLFEFIQNETTGYVKLQFSIVDDPLLDDADGLGAWSRAFFVRPLPAAVAGRWKATLFGSSSRCDFERLRIFMNMITLRSTTTRIYLIAVVPMNDAMWIISFDDLFKNTYTHIGRMSALLHLFGFNAGTPDRQKVVEIMGDSDMPFTAEIVTASPEASKRVCQLYQGLCITRLLTM